MELAKEEEEAKKIDQKRAILVGAIRFDHI